MNLFLQFLIVGWVVLIGAIAINALLNVISWQGWYAYLGNILSDGFKQAHQSISIPNLIFLYIGYPFLLGLCATVYRLLE